VRPRLILASYFLRRGAANKALQVAEEAALQAPDSPAVLVIWGRAQHGNKRNAAALKTFRTLVSAQPNNPSNQVNLSLAERSSGSLDDARRPLERALELRPSTISHGRSLAKLNYMLETTTQLSTSPIASKEIY
jgi:Flp pilus assembly protein TadD